MEKWGQKLVTKTSKAGDGLDWPVKVTPLAPKSNVTIIKMN